MATQIDTVSFQGFKSGNLYRIRRPNENDAEAIISYSKMVFSSTDQLLNTLEEYTITVDDEKTWISNLNKNASALLLVAEHESQIVGFLFFIPNPKKKNSHTGEFGVNVHPQYQGDGIGKSLVEALMLWARSNSKIEKVYLNVFATNKKAISLYKTLGFIEEGRHIKAARQLSGEYVDTIQMYLETQTDNR